ncbi:MarC family protein [Capnocytophaga catalasegens]|uniref:UPF0056 membrane protein n=1 Tax=Capnocytophaga catalasegens TaxID=1004260 RepID=A0AAV5AXL3_9FLAO|nr:MarC family protein [Capnocytophaga catalasegens]GIZ15723.1 UPF0056 inner membrane protein [Capnocytophaga catalasegens]GJM50110.1 UPF0056 inner membrane protein [Capnocytophaga catalasegens]GJM53065.1 UPF0056 inner membrane protein [Capnocytophaga catalasegens]
MELNWKEIGAVAIALFPIIDILGNLPIILSLRQKIGSVNSEKSAIVAGLLMIAFLFVGQAILNFMEIPIQAFAVGGAFILFILAVEMILGVSFHKTEIPDSVSIIPIAFPLLAGPGVLTTVLSMRSQYLIESIIIAIVINIVIVYVVMKLAAPIEKMLGKTGIIIVHKISGVILLALAIKLFAENWKILLP